MINDKKLVYLAAPYSHPDNKVVNKRVKTIAKVAGNLMKNKDVFVFSPISHGHPINLNIKGESIGYDNWLALDKAILDICDEMYIIDIEGWNESRGVQVEIDYCKTKNIPIRMVTKRGKVTKYAY